MSDIPISVAEAAQNLADYVERTHDLRQSFVLLEDGFPIARLVPVEARGCTGRDLAAALARVELSEEEAKAWQDDLRAAREALKACSEKWE